MSRIGSAYDQRFRDFHRVASAILGDADLGRDAVQEAFARAISRRFDYRGDGPLEAWLWRAVTNVARDYRRTARATVLLGDLPEGGSRGIEADSFDSTIRNRVARLPERQRTALFLRYYVDLSYTEIAEILEIRTGTVSATLNAAIKALRKDLSPELQRDVAEAEPVAVAVAA
ncbi:RNA polymerase sigma factor [Capillimicrobium parvum]|uniref:RNA polymerase sigma factor SigV n=1 Tax=Capillimicrobium parvum TaxID=2884022 RepID=A0A9E6XX06_9ACTN|nr:RNA polymerase sigma factor [Capillimicrobium parvum]UGS35929.1 RNA polymerase sigma factor SigV [Capillimicrobium parvum]